MSASHLLSLERYHVLSDMSFYVNTILLPICITDNGELTHYRTDARGRVRGVVRINVHDSSIPLNVSKLFARIMSIRSVILRHYAL